MATVTQLSLGGMWLGRTSYQRNVVDGRINDRVHHREGLCASTRRADGDYERPLSALIEREIIPRLMAAHSSGTPPGTVRDGPPRDTPFRDGDEATGGAGGDGAAKDDTTCIGAIQEAEIAAFAPLAMQVDADVLLAHIESILDSGISVESVMVDLLAPAARVLGEYWEEDQCDFVDVTMGLWRLQEVVHEIAGRLPANHIDADGRRRALFVSLHGDQHYFGTVVIEEVFRRGGWLTDRMCEVETPRLLKAASGGWFDMIGLTITCECNIAHLSSIIAALRKVSRNPRIRIMVGGAAFSADPALATRVGADGTARDAKLALKLADDLLRECVWGTAACS